MTTYGFNRLNLFTESLTFSLFLFTLYILSSFSLKFHEMTACGLWGIFYHSLIHSPTHQLIHTITHPLINSFTHQLILVIIGSGCLSQSHWIPDPVDGCRVRQLLHQGSNVDPYQGVPVSRRGDEKDCLEGKTSSFLLLLLLDLEGKKGWISIILSRYKSTSFMHKELEGLLLAHCVRRQETIHQIHTTTPPSILICSWQTTPVL